MKFLEYVYENTEGLTFIDKLISTVKSIVGDGIKTEFNDVTEEDISKLSLIIEFNFFDKMCSDDSEWNFKTISVDNVKFLIGSTIGFYNLCGGLDKIRRQSYSEILWDVIYNVLGSIDNVEKLFKSSDLIKKVVETIKMIECGEDGFSYDLFTVDELQQCITDIYKFTLKDKIEF